jgi:hypothetical protein
MKSDLGAAATLGKFLELCGAASIKGCAFSAGSAKATRMKYARLLQGLRHDPVTTSIPAFGDTPETPTITFTSAFLVSTLTKVLYTVKEVPGFAPGWAYGASILQTLWTASTTGQIDARATRASLGTDFLPDCGRGVIHNKKERVLRARAGIRDRLRGQPESEKSSQLPGARHLHLCPFGSDRPAPDLGRRAMRGVAGHRR